jgi:hypothetical protein
LNEEMTEHLGHEKNQAELARESTNVRNGSRGKTVISDAADGVQIDVPRDRKGTFEPQIVAAHQRNTKRGETSCVAHAAGLDAVTPARQTAMARSMVFRSPDSVLSRTIYTEPA